MQATLNNAPMNPNGTGFQAIDSEDGTASAHAYEWVKRVGPGAYTVEIDRRVLVAGTPFYTDDWTLDVQLRIATQLAHLALDLGLDVERLAPAAHAAGVAREHVLADLRAQGVVDHRRGEAAELLLDVDRRAGRPRRGGRCGRRASGGSRRRARRRRRSPARRRRAGARRRR